MGTNLTEFKEAIIEEFDNLTIYKSIMEEGNCEYYKISVKHEGNNIARASFTVCQCEVGIIGELVVEEKHRKKGYGKKTLKYIEHFMAIENNIKILTLIPLPDSRGFWEHMDYMNVGNNGMCKDIWEACRNG
jgi:N-acetylglutamate synthase-like GNAT family acetyltransferase